MRVVAVASRKGGSGKTTLTGHLAVQAERLGDGPVAVADLDPQGSLAEWWNAREAEMPAFAQADVERIEDNVEALRALGFTYLFLDLPPVLDGPIADALRLSDLVVIPIRPSPHDLRSVGTTVEQIEAIGKPLVFVLNAATARSKIATEAVIALSHHGPLAPTTLHHRVDFAASMIDGRTVMELPGSSRSADEVAELWDYLVDRLEGRVADADLMAPAARHINAGGRGSGSQPGLGL